MNRTPSALVVLAAALAGCGTSVKKEPAEERPAEKRPPVSAEKLAAMAEDLRYGDKEARCFAAAALGRTGDAGAVDPLVRALGDEDPEVQGSVAEALVAIGEPSVRPLIEVLKSEYTDVRRAAAAALMDATGQSFGQDYGKWREWHDERGTEGASEGPAAEVSMGRIAPLVRKLNDQNARTRAEAAEELAGLGHRKALDPLIEALEDSYQPVRCYAAQGLGKTGDPMAVEALVEAFRGSWDRRREGRLSKSESDYMSGALLAIGMPGVEGLFDLLGDEDRQTLSYAYDAVVKRLKQDLPKN